MPGVFRGGLRAFRHRTQRTVLALCESGQRYRADGQRDGAGRVEDPEGAWESVLRTEGDEIVGQPILPVGRACRETVRLPAAEWRQALAPGDPVLEIHIPAGPPMDYAACAVSIRRAIEFFPRHFPDRPFVAFVCSSWILDAQFEALLPPTSNLVRFQKEVYLYPVRSSGDSTLETVFGSVCRDPAALPRETTMQRAFARHLEQGGHFRGGGCFLFPCDFRWGSRFYRRQRLPVTEAVEAVETRAASEPQVCRDERHSSRKGSSGGV